MQAEPVPYMERTRRYYEAQGFEAPYLWAHNQSTPFVAPAGPISESVLTLITTAALHEREKSDRRDLMSGPLSPPPSRLFANDLAWDRNATHLEDLNSYFPIDRLTELVAAGRIGRLAARFHCVPTEYSQRRTTELDAPEILRRCREDGVDAVLLVPL
ncbi:MAG: hypothetical protein OXP09_08150 [Gammaproteobacteria bacterium]|nr:hypothetical protein [Gammaproteobacteria bacterium]